MINKGLFTSETGEWATPQKFFDELNAEFHFTLDAAATKENAKCKRYFTKEDDALTKKWTGRVWLNPVYGRGIGAWVKKAYEEATKENADLVVCLVPARTDTSWFWDYCFKGEVRFVRGRLKFGDGRNSAPFPSAVIIFRKPNE